MGDVLIVVKVELHSARTGAISELAKMHIANVGVTGRYADYHGRVLRKPRFSVTTRETTVFGHIREAEPIWCLIGKMLLKMGYVK